MQSISFSVKMGDENWDLFRMVFYLRILKIYAPRGVIISWETGSGVRRKHFMACAHRAPHFQSVDLVLMVVYGIWSDHVDGPDKGT